MRAIEFTLTNPEAPAVITELRRVCPDFNAGTAAIGLGSVRTAQEARMALDAGAQFLVSPIALASIVIEAKKHDVAVCLGAYTPTDIATGWEFGADIVKVFPARSLGPSFVRDVLAPMPYLRLMPTGGVDLNNIREYLGAGAVAVGVGGKFIDQEHVRAERWDEVTRRDDATDLEWSASMLMRSSLLGNRTTFPRTRPNWVSMVTPSRMSLCQSVTC